MGWLKSLFEGYILKKGLAKATKAAVSVIVGLVMGAKIQPILTQLGVTLDPAQLEAGVTVFVTGAVTGLMNWLKTRYGVRFL